MNRRRDRPISTRRKLEFLRRPQTYPGQKLPVRVIETHFAWVFLTEQHAYKMKKPLRQDVMDYRSIANRARGCSNELRLNRRLAPTVYLESVPLARTRNGDLVLGRGGRIVDWLVKMRRLPAARMLECSIKNGTLSVAERRAVIAMLAQFYARARQRPMSSARYVTTLRARMLENLRELQVPEFGMDHAILGNIVAKQRRYIDDHVGLLASRAGRLVEAHGDLRPEHVYLGSRLDPPGVIDCLEFDAKLRRMDPAEEVAFLALECRRLGAESMARSLIHGVQSSLEDVVPESLTYFYMSHRALTRAKMAVWHLRDPRRPRRIRHWKERARAYVEDALYFAELAVRRSEQRRCVSPRQPQANGSTGAQWAYQTRSA